MTSMKVWFIYILWIPRVYIYTYIIILYERERERETERERERDRERERELRDLQSKRAAVLGEGAEGQQRLPRLQPTALSSPERSRMASEVVSKFLPNLQHRAPS